MIEFHDPRADVGTEQMPYNLILGNGDVTVALLANGFPDSDAFLEQIGSVLAEAAPGVRVRHWNKGNASIIANDAMLTDIETECDAAIAAYGH